MVEIRISKWFISEVQSLKNGRMYKLVDDMENPGQYNVLPIFSVNYDNLSGFMANEFGARADLMIGKPIYLAMDQFGICLAIISKNSNNIYVIEHEYHFDDKSIEARYNRVEQYLMDKHSLTPSEFQTKTKKEYQTILKLENKNV